MAESTFDQAPAILLAGPPGVGKTMLASRLGSQPSASGQAERRRHAFSSGNRQALFTEFDPAQRLRGQSLTLGDRFIAGVLLVTCAAGSKCDVDGELRRMLAELRYHGVDDAVPKFLVINSGTRRVHPEIEQALTRQISQSRAMEAVTTFPSARRGDRGETNSAEDVLDPDALTREHGLRGTFNVDALASHGLADLAASLRAGLQWPPESEDADPIKAAVISAVRELIEKLCYLIASNPSALDHLEWRQVEQIVARSLRALGFQADLTRCSKDGGKDTVVTYGAGARRQTFYIEIKHWHERSRCGERHIKRFVRVNVRDGTDGGLFLSTSGYTSSVYSQLAEIAGCKIRLGEKEKIVSLCRHFVRTQSSVWKPQLPLTTVLVENTLTPPQG